MNATKYTEKRIVCLERMPTTNTTATGIITSKTRLALYYLYLTGFARPKKSLAPSSNVLRL